MRTATRNLMTMLSILGLLLGSFVAFAAPARAASLYDDLLEVTDELYLRHLSSGRFVNHSTDWYSTAVATLQEPCLKGDTFYCDGFMDLQQLLDGYWLVYEYHHSPTSMRNEYRIIWTTSRNGQSCEFINGLNHPEFYCSGGDFHQVIFTFPSSGNEYEYPSINDVGDFVEPHHSIVRGGGGEVYRVFLNTFPVSYPAGYEGEILPDTWSPAPVKYVAMGDSFSSGEGVEAFHEETDIFMPDPDPYDQENMCHRSYRAYPNLLVQDPDLDIRQVDFVACSGATTAHVLYGGPGTGSWDEGPQVDALSVDTEIVTITVGGNDVGFADYASLCVVFFCGPGTPAYATIMGEINSTQFLDDLKSTYREILGRSSSADVYVITYPYIFDPDSSASPSCGIVDNSGATLVVDSLNITIGLAVSQVQSESSDWGQRLHIVSATASDSPFIGGHLCSEDWPLFHGITTPAVYSLHPNREGQIAYHSLVKEAIS